jgi:hypothetical protein
VGELLSTEPVSFIIQAAKLPVFSCLTPSDQRFLCGRCGHVLIENYFKDTYCDINIKCFQCASINKLPEISLGEVLSISTINMGSGRYFINETLKVPLGKVVASDEEIRKTLSLISPRYYNDGLIISKSHLRSLSEIYDGLTGGKFELQRSIINRGGKDAKEDYPFVWAVITLTEKEIDLKNSDVVYSIFCVQAFSHVIGTWKHHPRFDVVAPGLGKKREFFHTVYQLVVMAHLFRSGNPIGISIGGRAGEPNPDLYIRGLVDNPKIYIEVKAPSKLQWSGGVILSVSEVEKIIKDCIKRSSDQINKLRPGILVIGSNLNLGLNLKSAISKILNSDGRNHKHLSAVFFIDLAEIIINPTKNHCEFSATTTFHVEKKLNEFYIGEQIFN